MTEEQERQLMEVLSKLRSDERHYEGRITESNVTIGIQRTYLEATKRNIETLKKLKSMSELYRREKDAVQQEAYRMRMETLMRSESNKAVADLFASILSAPKEKSDE